MMPSRSKRLVEQPLGDRVDHHVAGPSVKGQDPIGKSPRGNGGEIGDSADVLRDPSPARVPIQQIVEERNQRRPFASRGHIRRTEIRNHRHSHAGCDHRAFAGLPGGRDPMAQKALPLALMVERLPVTADELYFAMKSALRCEHRVGVEFRQQEVEPRQMGDTGLAVAFMAASTVRRTCFGYGNSA